MGQPTMSPSLLAVEDVFIIDVYEATTNNLGNNQPYGKKWPLWDPDQDPSWPFRYLIPSLVLKYLFWYFYDRALAFHLSKPIEQFAI